MEWSLLFVMTKSTKRCLEVSKPIHLYLALFSRIKFELEEGRYPSAKVLPF